MAYEKQGANSIRAVIVLSIAWFSGQASAAAPVIPTPSHPSSLMPAIMRAYRTGLGGIVIPPGVYKLPQPRGSYYLSFDNMRNFRIIGKGVTLLRTDPTKGGIEFNHCRNVDIDGLTLRCDPIPFTQARIAAIDPQTKSITVQICRGYPNLTVVNPGGPHLLSYFGNIFNPRTFRISHGSPDIWYTRRDDLGGGRFRLFTSEPLSTKWKGDLMAFRGAWHTPDIYVYRCGRMLVEHVTVTAGTGFCFAEGRGEGYNRYLDDRIIYPPTPRNATTRPLLSSNCDGFHTGFYPVAARHGPEIIGCRFEGTDDDGIAIHGAYATVKSINGRKLVIFSKVGDFVRGGNRLKFYTNKGGYIGQAVVVSIEPPIEYKPHRGRTPAEPSRYREFCGLTLNHPVPGASFDDLVSDPNRNGSGFIIRDCTVKDNRARGLLIKADNGIIEGNKIEWSSMEGIVVAPELNWNEAGCSCNLLIDDNLVRHVGYANTGPAYMTGAISVAASPLSNLPPAAFGHDNIAILGNRLISNSGTSLLVVDARNVLIAGNRFINVRWDRDTNVYGPADPIWLQECRNVLLAGNIASFFGPPPKTCVGVGPGVTSAKGIKTGLRVANITPK